MSRWRFPGEIDRRSSKLCPQVESLEGRLILSTIPTTVTMAARLDGMIGAVATAPVMVISGQTMPDATVAMKVGKITQLVHSNQDGAYIGRFALPSGSYIVKVKAENPSGQVSSASMKVTHGDAVLAWVDTTINVIRADKTNVGLASRTMAMVSGAVYDAVNAIERTGSVYKIDVAAPAGASASAAASEAAYTVLSALDPLMAPLLEVRMAQSLAAETSSTAASEGIQVGAEVAQGILGLRANDGSSESVPYVPGTAPGQWQPTPPTYQVAWGPNWGQVETFATTLPASFFVAPPPPALNSLAYASALQQVESIGSLQSKTRTADETQIGVFWSYDNSASGTPPIHYEQIAETIALQEHNTLTQDARLFGLVNLSMADAGIAAWDTKYLYNRWRPITAIRLAATDGNPATTADRTWTPLGSPGNPGQPNFTPPFPSYVSGHATFGQALFTTLEDFYGTDHVRFTLTSDNLPGVTRSYSSFSQASAENAISRVYLGIHFLFDETAGMTVGREVATNIFDNVLTIDPSNNDSSAGL